jgi:hypothetical protein
VVRISISDSHVLSLDCINCYYNWALLYRQRFLKYTTAGYCRILYPPFDDCSLFASVRPLHGYNPRISRHKGEYYTLRSSPTFLCCLFSSSYVPLSVSFFGCESEARRRPNAGGKTDWKDAGWIAGVGSVARKWWEPERPLLFTRRFACLLVSYSPAIEPSTLSQFPVVAISYIRNGLYSRVIIIIIIIFFILSFKLRIT